MNTEHQSMATERKPQEPYHRPQLVEYGSLQNLTQAVFPNGYPDNFQMFQMSMRRPGMDPMS